MKIFAISILIGAALISTACFNNTTKNSSSNTSSDTGNTKTTSETINYPQLYKDANLPEHSGATLQDVGRQQESLRDGLKLQLESAVSVRDLAEYYQKELEILGWTIPAKKFPNDSAYLGSFTKGDRIYQVTITKIGDKTNIIINYLEN